MSYHFTGVRPYFRQNRRQENYHANNYYFPSFQPSQNQQMYAHRPMNCNVHQPSYNISEQHWCETCDRGFKTSQQLETHKQQHQKCNIDGCQFVAHPKVITKHIQMQHSSGLYKRISKLDNPEEIKKWIEERKKKYPTKSNIEKKSAEIKEKIERGEKMGLRQERFQQNNYRGDGVKRKHNNNFNNHLGKKYHLQDNVEKSKTYSKSKVRKVGPPKKVNTLPAIYESRRLRPFTGIQNIDMDIDSNDEAEQNECNFDIEDDDTFNNSENGKTTGEPTLCGALTSLMCNYGSSDEEMTSKSIQNTVDFTEIMRKETKLNDIPKATEDNKSDDDSGPEEIKVVHNTNDIDVINCKSAKSNNVAKKQVTRRNDHTSQNKRRTFIRLKPNMPTTLLHKLLQKEVQHERNVILQCVRYIVKNNYFDNEQK
ncbi:FMR1-interacting protein NUFIP1 [Plodia interpunctella]|uniref:FMR1-interacting protein NUFIP1 n=1 Tax=Plodia interpunctella TaxID=58824 RepID=UPI002367F7C7|nr:FMR1-interacting protein NUFIP1 [Plodia interpunctella]